MNPVLRKSVYQMGNQKQVDFIIKVAGMNREEQQMFRLLHGVDSEECIMAELGYSSKKTYKDAEQILRKKVAAGILEAINGYMSIY